MQEVKKLEYTLQVWLGLNENIPLDIGWGNSCWSWFVYSLCNRYVTDTLIWMYWIYGMTWVMWKDYYLPYGCSYFILENAGWILNSNEIITGNHTCNSNGLFFYSNSGRFICRKLGC